MTENLATILIKNVQLESFEKLVDTAGCVLDHNERVFISHY